MKHIFKTLFVLSCLTAFLISPIPMQAQEQSGSMEGPSPYQTVSPLSVDPPLPSPGPTPNPNDIWDDTSVLRTSGIYTYQIVNASLKQAVIREIHSAETKLNIPASLDGYKIIGVGLQDNAYSSQYLFAYQPDLSVHLRGSLKTLTFSEGIQYIGTQSFSGCESLTTLTLPKNLKSIEGGAFSGCSSLKKIKIPKSGYMEELNIKDGAFAECVSLDEVKFETAPCFGDSPFHFSHIKKLVLSLSNAGDFSLNVDYADIDQIYVDSSVKKLSFEGIGWYSKVKSIIVNNKKTQIELWSPDYRFGSLCTLPKAKCINWAKKRRLTYKTKSCGKMSKPSRKKKKLSWKKVKTTIRTHQYNSSNGWSSSARKAKTYYIIYGKNSKKARYKQLKTTAKTSCRASYKYMKVSPKTTW